MGGAFTPAPASEVSLPPPPPSPRLPAGPAPPPPRGSSGNPRRREGAGELTVAAPAPLPPLPASPPGQDECERARLPTAWRDGCSSLLIPLNACRRANLWWPGSCEHEKHAYEKCQYEDYMSRVRHMHLTKWEEGQEKPAH